LKERIRTLRNQLLLWVSAPLLALWVISTIIDHDVATAFVNLNYDCKACCSASAPSPTSRH